MTGINRCKIIKSAARNCGALFFAMTLLALHNEAATADGPGKICELKEQSRFSLSAKDSLKKKPVEFKMKKDPWKAVLYSAILPGAGQFYNESYWKVGVVAGLGGYFAYGIINNNNKYSDYKEQYSQSQTTSNPAGDPQLQAFRDFYRDQRDDFIVYAVILYVANLIDAYVDAQLFDFTVSDKRNFPSGNIRFKLNF